MDRDHDPLIPEPNLFRCVFGILDFTASGFRKTPSFFGDIKPEKFVPNGKPGLGRLASCDATSKSLSEIVVPDSMYP
jgi:hypothetical protein